VKPLHVPRGRVVVLGLALLAGAAALGFALGRSESAVPARTSLVPPPAAAPSGWQHLALPDGTAVLFYPPTMHRVGGDTDAVSAARLDPDGKFLLYLNATPRQGEETLRNWASYRLRVLRSDDASQASLVASSQGQPFRGGTGSCVIDRYVTRVGAHRYTELACLVQGRTAASVIVAAAPTPLWASARAVLAQAVSAYTVR
jgi:hypothetical protein